MARVVVIGAGPMGLAAAHKALTLGHDVDLVEADAVAGGMAAHFDFGGLSIERFYHFVCKSDEPTFDLMSEIGIGDRMRWTATSMGYWTQGKLHPWGSPWALLVYPHLSFLSKIRTGLQMFLTTKARRFDQIEALTAREWIERGSGRQVYDALWRRLLELKFHRYSNDISASWIATRVKRIGTSRRSIFQEELGYIEGGSQTLVAALVAAIEKRGGRIHLGRPARRVITERGDDGRQRVAAVDAGHGIIAADAVLSTIPIPLVNNLVPDLPQDWKDRYASIRNIGVVCLLFKLKRSVTKHFWLNIIDQTIEIPGLIEFSNLRPIAETIVYVPYYMPVDHPKWGWDDRDFVTEAYAYIKRINPAITDPDLIDARVGRLRYAQPVCEPNFGEKIPPIQTPIVGLQIADTCYYYPEDRGIAESIRLGRKMADSVGGASHD